MLECFLLINANLNSKKFNANTEKNMEKTNTTEIKKAELVVS
jgi:hypothetical protein